MRLKKFLMALIMATTILPNIQIYAQDKGTAITAEKINVRSMPSISSLPR